MNTAGPTLTGMTYRSTPAYPGIDQFRAISALRGNQRELAARTNAVINWSTLHVAGQEGRRRSWSSLVRVDGDR